MPLPQPSEVPWEIVAAREWYNLYKHRKFEKSGIISLYCFMCVHLFVLVECFFRYPEIMNSMHGKAQDWFRKLAVSYPFPPTASINTTWPPSLVRRLPSTIKTTGVWTPSFSSRSQLRDPLRSKSLPIMFPSISRWRKHMAFPFSRNL